MFNSLVLVSSALSTAFALSIPSNEVRATGGRFQADLCANLYGLDYRVNITLGGQLFEMLVDTGSAALWVVEKGFACTDVNGNANAAICGMTRFYDNTTSTTYKEVPDEYLYAAYVDGTRQQGSVGTEVLGLGGVESPDTTFGIANKVSSLYAFGYDGIFGFTISANAPAYYNQSGTRARNASIYPPSPLEVAIANGLLNEPVFSLSLDTPSYGYMFGTVAKKCNSGQLVLGGNVENVPVTDTTVTVPFMGYNPVTLDFPYDEPDKVYSQYSLKIDSFNFPGSDSINQTDFQAILDSGTYQNLLPSPIVQAYAKLITPPATAAGNGYYNVDCRAVAPDFSITIGGKNFTVAYEDLVTIVGIGNVTDASTWTCQLGMVDANVNSFAGDGTRLFLLGQLFQHNVVSSANLGTMEITLTQRQPQDVGSLPPYF